jgi:hypothetical protein
MRFTPAWRLPFALRSKAKAGGGGEIRTHEAFRPSGFQDRRDQPLCHPSGETSSDWKTDYPITLPLQAKSIRTGSAARSREIKFRVF